MFTRQTAVRDKLPMTVGEAKVKYIRGKSEQYLSGIGIDEAVNQRQYQFQTMACPTIGPDVGYFMADFELSNSPYNVELISDGISNSFARVIDNKRGPDSKPLTDPHICEVILADLSGFDMEPGYGQITVCLYRDYTDSSDPFDKKMAYIALMLLQSKNPNMKSKVLAKNLGTDDYSMIIGENGQWTNLVKRENLLNWAKEQPMVKDESGQSTLNLNKWL
ncbi:hypothetical protein IT417_03610 [bacterium]|nr:hypothetical protein [bacterium]